ncbi:NADH-quinone oxidoreductase subunit NuoN [Ornithinimicrobium faecis]|uniref:NADH-quinone oxidoreductase subunit N n=1 Tax=Ornithinimicrobium faecis TaxID=2934158 RepID=A0ABY4YVR7_9MICO|nr:MULTISPECIES: NADH-quinone oxidoreductase subunit NuoN [unclassified Ornithinimicrobium]USQ80828.1 NADH-quinone oxidoreductase subunit NuoN [Ornithinimicrobium sp. HY1793]
MFVAPEIDYLALLPLIVVFAGGLIGCLLEGFLKRQQRVSAQLWLTIGTLVVALVTLIWVARDNQGITAAGAVTVDGPTLMIQGLLLVLSILGVLVMSERLGGTTPDAFTQSGVSVPGSAEEADAVRLGGTTTEIYPLTLLAIGGMMLFPAANDLILMFIALEILSLPLYILSGLARRRRLLSQEAALKYFLLGAFSSAFFLFGAVLLYGYSGSMRLDVIAEAIGTQTGMDGLLIPGILLLATGLLFKVGAVPFHSWTPDVYQGAPTPVTGFMAACTKVAAFGAMLRLFYVGVEAARLDWQPILAVVAAITMVVGAVVSIVQTDIKRILAYSSIAHAGFILTGLLAMEQVGASSTMFYLAAYGFMTVPAFALVALVRSAGSEATHVNQWSGLGKRSPWMAAAFSFLLLAFAGIPLTSGFTGKFAVFAAAIANDYAWLAVIGVLASAVTAYIYFKVIVTLYFGETRTDTVVVTPSALTTFAVVCGVLVTLGLGVAPAPVLDLAANAAQFLR